jgi:hypothetical protein
MEPGRRPAVREDSRDRRLPRTKLAYPAGSSGLTREDLMPWAGAASPFPLNATLAAWRGVGDALRLARVTSCRVGHPSGRLCSAASRRELSSDHTSAAVIHLCRCAPLASAASFIAAAASRLGSYSRSMNTNIAADRKRSRTSGTVPIRGRHHTGLSSRPEMPREAPHSFAAHPAKKCDAPPAARSSMS